MASNNFSSTLREANSTLTQAGRVADTAGDIASTLGVDALFSGATSGVGMGAGAATTASALATTNLQGGQPQAANPSVLSGGTQIINGKKYFINPAPKGTRLIIPARLSSTGQERYIGAHVLESIMNFHQGKSNCANMIIFNNQNQPSATFYDFGPNGEIYLKGTTTQIKFDQNDPPVQLSEAEYMSIVQSLNQNPNDVTYFKTTADRGDAENSKASEPSWFSRNWWKILLGLVIAGGIAWGGIALHDRKKEKDEEKELKVIATQTDTQNNNVNTASEPQAQAQAQGLSSAQNITNQTSTQPIITTQNSNSL